MSAETEIVIAIRNALIASADLVAAVGGEKVFDQTAPQLAVMPYVTIGECALSENDFDQGSAFDATVDIHTWSEERSRMEANEIQEHIREALHRNETLAPTGFGVSGIHQLFSRVMIDPDNITRHGVQSFQIYFEPITGS